MRIFTSLSLLLIISILSTMSIAPSTAEDQLISPQPTPRFTLTVPRINEITYKIDVTNVGNLSSYVRIDVALPKTWAPDTYVEIKEITISRGVSGNYSSRENDYIYAISNLGSQESMEINITFYSLKYKLEYYTHKRVQNISYPNEIAIYTQPEKYIESNDTTIESLAAALVGERKNPFRIAEKIYDFVISHLRYEIQPEIRGALWALLNRKGDCTEYGTLFVALMRAAGIPARIVTGHMSKVLSQGGKVNATRLWVDSPHLWAEFYVEGFGWIPVDPTSGEGDPWNNFAILWAMYLPFLKGPVMEAPYRALFTIKAQPLEFVNYNATLLVNPLDFLPFKNQAFLSIYEANEATNTLRRTAYKAYTLGFNITETYPLIQETYDSLYNATQMIGQGNSLSAGIYAKNASLNAGQTLELISTLVLNEARTSIARAWRELRLLGALSGEFYIKRAEEHKSNSDYANMVKYAHYARASADQAPSIFIFIAVVLLCVFTIWMVNRKAPKKK